MKRMIPIALIGGAVILFSNTSKTKSLNELVKGSPSGITFTSNGEYNGKSVIMTVHSPGAKKMNFTVKKGTLFYPENEDEQTLVVPHDKLMAFDPNGKASIELYGFCTESSDKCPSENSKFVMGTTKDEKLLKLLEFFKENKGIDRHTVQEAIWCVTDNEPISNVYMENKPLGVKLRKKLSEITGQPVPWHTKKREVSVDQQGEIVATPIEVVGDVVFSTIKKTTVLSHIENEAGEVVWNPGQKFEIPKAMRGIKLDFKVRVSGWTKGKYYVKYYTATKKPIVTKVFEV